MNEDIVEALDESMTPKMPEAPQSIHVDGYYKGFHAGFTIRKESNKSVAVSETTNLINALIENGWKPSWNEETNGNHEKPLAEKQEECQHPETSELTVKNGKNAGRKFLKCKVCGAFVRFIS